MSFNGVFKHFPYSFVIVFIDDIWVYSKSEEDMRPSSYYCGVLRKHKLYKEFS